MSVLKSDDFISDVERQFEWYVLNAGWDIADAWLDSVEPPAGCWGSTRCLARAPG